jgi:hypothetical protein
VSIVSAQVDLKIHVPKHTTSVEVMHGDTTVTLTPRFRKVIIKNVDEPCRIKMIPSGEVVIYEPKKTETK